MARRLDRSATWSGRTTPRLDHDVRAVLIARSPPAGSSKVSNSPPGTHRRTIMELPLTPLDFARRARKVYADREALVDGPLRLTYAEFFDRCERWAAALQRLGVRHGDRVAVIAPNTHAMLEAFYAVPQLGAVIV